VFNISGLTPGEAQLVWNALAELPGKLTYLLMQKVEKQLREQGAMGVVSTEAANETSSNSGG